MTESRDKKELALLFPGVKLTLETGEEIVVKPITFGKLREFIDAISSLFLKLEEAGVEDVTNPESWGKVISIAFDEIAQIMIVILEKDRAWVDNLDLNDLMAIWTQILAQNVNETSKKNFSGLADQIKSLIPSSPNTSSDTDTPGTPSSDSTSDK